MTISKAAAICGVTPRMIRNYEKAGLLESRRMDDNDYRVYDDSAIMRLRQIILLRKLRLPLKQIAIVLSDGGSARLIEILRENLGEINGEIAALSSVRGAINALIARLAAEPAREKLSDGEIVEIAETFMPANTAIREGFGIMELDKANELLDSKTRVRVIILPPLTVASLCIKGKTPEKDTGDILEKFVKESGLYEKKPDSRMFGFNHPSPTEIGGDHGYEVWLTIPEDMEVPAPIEKKRIEGGMFAAHTIVFPNFHEWELLMNWAQSNDTYAANYSPLGDEVMGGCLEEHLNWVHDCANGLRDNGGEMQIDLLLPIVKK